MMSGSPAVAASNRGDDSAPGLWLGLGLALWSRSNFTVWRLPWRREAAIKGVRRSLERMLGFAPASSRALVLAKSAAAQMSAVAFASFVLLGSASDLRSCLRVSASV